MKKYFISLFVLLLLSGCTGDNKDKVSMNRFPLIPISPYTDLVKDKVYSGYLSLYKNKEKALKMTDKIMTVIRYYRSVLIYVELTDKPFDVILATSDGARYQFAEGRFVNEFTDYIENRNSVVIYRYPETIESDKEFRYRKGNPLFHFYESVYGRTNEEVIAGLTPARVFGRNRRFSTRNNALYFLEKTSVEIEKAAESDSEIAKWIDSIKDIYTYSDRNIATRDVPSLHSFGIAIDFRFYKEREHIYWYWSSFLVEDWWDIPREEIVAIPEKVVKIFERNGFAWGGKWPNYDVMHFEYRPEIVHRKFTYDAY